MDPHILPDLEAIQAACEAVYGTVSPTPQYRWPLLEEALGTELWVKHENHTPTGSFKARTAIAYAADHIARHPHVSGFIAATKGNHGQAVALAAKSYGRSATIIVPRGNSLEKNAAMRAQGATLIEHGDDFQAAKEYANAHAAEIGGHFIPSFHPLIVAGVASYWMELFRAVPDIDVAYVPVGQGSGICAALAARTALNLKTEIIGVVSDHAPAYALSVAKGRAVEAHVSTRLADGLACRSPDPASLAILLAHKVAIRRVTDAEVANAMRLYFTATHNVIEGAGAAPLAAALQDRKQLAGKRVAVIACGGNVDSDVFARVLAGANE